MANDCRTNVTRGSARVGRDKSARYFECGSERAREPRDVVIFEINGGRSASSALLSNQLLESRLAAQEREKEQVRKIETFCRNIS